MYREGLSALDADSLAKASAAFMRWIRLAPKGKHAEMLIDPRLQKLKRSSYWSDIVIEVRKRYARYKDSQHAFYLDSLYFEDQRYRTPDFHDLSGSIEEIDTVVLPVFRFTEKQALLKDSINLVAAQRYFDKNGYPTIAAVGRRPARGFGYIILHSGDQAVYEKYIPIVEQVCMDGEAEWSMYAMMCDKLSVVKNEPQKFGTQYQLNENKQAVLYKIDNVDAVNARRIHYGLTPLPTQE